MVKFLLFEIFTDSSSYIDNKTHSCASAFYIYHKDKLIFKGSKFFKNGTNNFGEVYAILLGLKTFKNLLDKVEDGLLKYPIKVNIYTDSLITCKGCKDWIHQWIEKSNSGILRTANGKVVANQEIFKEIYSNFIKNKLFNIHFIHINSHILSLTDYNTNLDKIKKLYDKENVNDIPDQLFKTSKFKKARKSFIEKNKFKISDMELLRLLMHNHDVDCLAAETLKAKLKKSKYIKIIEKVDRYG